MKTSNLLAAAMVLALGSVPGRAAAEGSAASADQDSMNQNSDSQYQGQGAGIDDPNSEFGVGGTGNTCPCPGSEVGGSGDTEALPTEPLPQDQVQPSDEGVGGTGETCECPDGQISGTEEGVGGTGMYGDRPSEIDQNVVVIEQGKSDEKASNEGVSIRADGGVAGYTGNLAPNVDPGGAWGVMVAAQPHPILGFELGYDGATNNITDPAASDGRITRNGGTANVKVALSPTKVEPYLFGGVGFAHASVTDAPAGSGYNDDTFGRLPVGAGVDVHLGPVTAGVRGTYETLFGRDFAPTGDAGVGFTGEQPNIWNGLAQVGAKF